MEVLFYITFILYIFFKTLHITNNKKNIEIDVIYLFFYLVEMIFKTEVYFIFSLLNITFMMYYDKKQIKKFTLVLYETVLTYIIIVILFKPSIIVSIILGLLTRNVILFYRKLNKRVEEIKYKNKINTENLILINSSYVEQLKLFLLNRPDVVFISSNNVYKELSKKIDKFTKYVVTDSNDLIVKNVIDFSCGKVNDLDVYSLVKNIKYKNGKSTITYIENNKKHTMTTNLISYDENVLVLSLYFLGKMLSIKENDIKRGINNIKSKKITISKIDQNILISNINCLNINNHYEGLDLIDNYRGNKIIVTGGIKSDDEKVNFDFSNKLMNFKYIILLNTNYMPLIYERLIENNYDRNNIYIIEHLNDYKKIINILGSDKTYILLDNDI